MSLVIAVMGFAGGMTMSAIKRDRGVKDYGTLVEGHGGVLDRIDSICFAAPVFYHLTRFFFVPSSVADRAGSVNCRSGSATRRPSPPRRSVRCPAAGSIPG